MRAPAALLAGAVVPIGFMASPKIVPEDPRWLVTCLRLSAVSRVLVHRMKTCDLAKKRVKRMHYVIASVAICCFLDSSI